MSDSVLMLKTVLRRVIPLALTLGCGVASAHIGADAGAHHGFLDGLLHPVTGVDHLGAMLAVGLWSATATRRSWLAPVSFALTLLLGALLAQAGWAFPVIEPMIVASLLVLGLLLAVRAQMAPALGAALVGSFALFHGAAHGQELSGAAALFGMVLGTATLHAVGWLLGMRLAQRGAWWSRSAGLVVAASGVVMGWSLLAN